MTLEEAYQQYDRQWEVVSQEILLLISQRDALSNKVGRIEKKIDDKIALANALLSLMEQVDEHLANKE